MMSQWSVRIDQHSAEMLFSHLFPGDGDEHGAVLAATIVRTDRETRLLVRKVFLAKDGVEYVAGQHGYKMLTAEFVRDCSDYCEQHGLAYLPVHNHGGHDCVKFSHDDMRSHERGYPALTQFTGTPVCALVFAENAVAGDIWLPSGKRFSLEKLVVTGKRQRTLRPRPLAVPHIAPLTHHRQALLLGAIGQHILANIKVGVIGAGGVGNLLVQYLARLGVGNLVVVDPERIDETNFSRLPEADVKDYRPPFWRKRTRKIDLARRIFRRANPRGSFEGIFGDFRSADVAKRFIDCDYIFLAADPMSVRLVFNQIVQQYLVPGIAVGSKVLVEKNTGVITEAFSIVRMVVPGKGCLWCNNYISSSALAREAETVYDVQRQCYVDDPEVVAPSVITLNAVGAGYAANAFLFSITDLGAPETYDYVQFDSLDGSIARTDARAPYSCRECSFEWRLAAASTQSMSTVAS